MNLRDFQGTQNHSHLGLLIKRLPYFVWDFDVYLANGKPLQRPLVWALAQKRAFIESIFRKRHIPPVSLVIDDMDVHRVIDGKQRITTILAFTAQDFSVILGGQEYRLSDLPKDFQTYWDSYHIDTNIIYGETTDQQKLQWFDQLNFGGSPQDDEHLAWVKSLLN